MPLLVLLSKLSANANPSLSIFTYAEPPCGGKKLFTPGGDGAWDDSTFWGDKKSCGDDKDVKLREETTP